MKKLILVSAIACALPVLANADTTIYGVVAMGIDSYNNGTITQHNVEDFGSKIGFKGTEDLGNGLKSLWQVESSFDASGSNNDSAGTFAGKTTFIGLQGDFGTVKMGRVHDVMVETEATDTFAGMGNDVHNLTYPVYESGYTPNFNLGHGIDAAGGVKNAISYTMPNWNGVDADLVYAAGENATQGASSTDRWGAHVEYTNAATKLFVGGAYETMLNQVADKDGYMGRLETGYAGDLLNVAFTYNRDSLYADTSTTAVWNNLGISSTTSHLTSNSYGMLVSYAIGAFTPRFEYSVLQNANVDGKTLQSSAKLAQFGLDYTISKRTSLEMAYCRVKDGADMQELLQDQSSTASTVYLQLTTKF